MSARQSARLTRLEGGKPDRPFYVVAPTQDQADAAARMHPGCMIALGNTDSGEAEVVLWAHDIPGLLAYVAKHGKRLGNR